MIEINKEQLEAIIKAVATYEEIIDGECGECRYIDEIHKAGDTRPIYNMLLDIRSKEEAKQKAEQIISDAVRKSKNIINDGPYTITSNPNL